MTTNDWPAYMVALCGGLFIFIGICYPWLSKLTNTAAPQPGLRLLSVVLGLVLLALWAIWIGVS